MSQKKVDRYKLEKKNRVKDMKKASDLSFCHDPRSVDRYSSRAVDLQL